MQKDFKGKKFTLSMELNLDERPFYYSFWKGSADYFKQRDLLLRDGRDIVCATEVLEHRARSSKNDWRNYSISTGNAILYSACGNRFKIVPDAGFLLETNIEVCKFLNGALKITEEVYVNTDGQEFIEEELDGLLQGPLLGQEAKSHPVLQYVAGSQELLDECVDKTFSILRRDYESNVGMGVFLSGERERLTARALVLDRYSGSLGRLAGNFSFNYRGAVLVGTARELAGERKFAGTIKDEENVVVASP